MAVPARPKLLVLTSSFPRFQDDFAGCFVADFANALTPFFDITILTPASIDIDEVEDRNGIHIIRFNYWWPKRSQLLDAAADLQPLLQSSLKAKLQLPTFFLAFLQKAYMLAKDADIICSHWLIPGGLIGTIIGQWFNKPHIIIEHSGAFHLLRRLKLQWLMRTIVKRATRVVTVSKQLRDQLIAITSSHKSKFNKIDTIPMGVDLDIYRNGIKERDDNRNICQILFLGRLTKIKGVDLLLSALNQLGSENLAYQLIVAGDGSDRAALELYAQEHLLPVKFVGMVGGQEKLAIINQSDIVVIPSIVLPDGRSEGLPVVCLEAFAAGKAVIAADVGGMRELISDGENGYLFPAGDVAILRTRLIELIKDRDRCRTFGEQAAITVAQYHWPLLASRYRALFYSALWQSLDDKEHWVSEAAD